MQHSHNASMNRDKNHACPNIVSKHARHARDFYDVTQTPSEIRGVFFDLHLQIRLNYVHFRDNKQAKGFIVYFNLTDGI